MGFDKDGESGQHKIVSPKGKENMQFNNFCNVSRTNRPKEVEFIAVDANNQNLESKENQSLTQK